MENKYKLGNLTASECRRVFIEFGRSELTIKEVGLSLLSIKKLAKKKFVKI
jgi:hypothetical protein